MKTVPKLFAFLFMLVSSAAFSEPITPKPSITLRTTRYQNLFAFKVNRKLKGALVEVYYSNGDLVAAKPLVKRKMIINFCDVKSGTYTIKVIKNNRVQEFSYVRK